MEIKSCVLTGYPLKSGELKPITSQIIEYETEYVGKVKLTISAYIELTNGDFDRHIIAGICKYRTINDLKPLLIDSEFIREGYKNENPPIEFEEKCLILLKTLYKLYGKENYKFKLFAPMHFPLAFATRDEFNRIIDQLVSDYFISYDVKKDMPKNNYSFHGVKVTNYGKEEAKKALPKMPLFGLVNQSITTGVRERDIKLNHARELFFSEPRTMDKMRSACESLSYVLEPLRGDLRNYFDKADVSTFFRIVNDFDIRHNKERTNTIKEAEQLEWIFYTLLNTINTYSKLKEKGK